MATAMFYPATLCTRLRSLRFFWLFVFLAATVCPAEVSIFDSVRPLVRQGKSDDALKLLGNIDALKGEDKSLAQFLKGRLLYTQAKFAEALPLLEAAVSDKAFRLNAYGHYHIGLIEYAGKDYKQARTDFERALQSEPNRDLENLTHFQLATMALEQKHGDEALVHLRKLEKRWKHDVKYPEVLFEELKVYLKKHQAARACKYARKLYAEFPGHPLVASWTIQLRDSKVDDQVLGCLITSKDQIRRIHRLQWAGQSARARTEIEFLRSKEKTPSYFLDSMLAQFLISEGDVDEAIKVLLKHYPLQKNNFGYLNLLARAAARAGEYETAVGAYYKAYHLAQGSRAGREALFQSAFLSYQFQDYDGAARKFDEFIRRYSRSGLRRDALWHLAWIRYLKGDYLGALSGLDGIQGPVSRRRRHAKIASDRVRYWKAMSLMKLNRTVEAANLFQTLTEDKNMGFYSVAARYRLEQIQPKATPVVSASPSATLAADEKAPPAVLPDPANGDSQEEEESEDTMSITKDDNSAPSEADGTEETTSDEEDRPEVTDFKSVKLTNAFDRANDLIRLGLYDWARFELFEIESRTRNKNYLQSLMGFYERIESYSRLAAIGDLNFATERQNEGLEKARIFWQAAFPQAYKTVVADAAHKFDIEPEIIWSIIRAESQYKADVVSPVGAIGLMQLMPQTGMHLANLLGDKQFAEGQLFDPNVNIRLGGKYLARLSTKFERSLPLIAAAYNAGPHRVDTWLISFGTLDLDEFIEHIPFVETRDYVKKVVRNYWVYQRVYKSNSANLAWIAKPPTVKPPKKAAARESWEI
jgi:soluble lytic murein transglycosylase